MQESQHILDLMKGVVRDEADALYNIIDSINGSYLEAFELIRDSLGKVVVTGMGKSGLIARKIATTMTSTGTLAVFLHPSEAAHGDLGVVNAADIVLAIGKSGESDELNSVFSVIKKLGAKIIAITANPRSTLSNYANVILLANVGKEACTYDLAPTSSTTVALAIGDALALALMKEKKFTHNDFALYHPGGRLERRLLLNVSDVYIPIEECSVLDPESATIKDILFELSSRGQEIYPVFVHSKSINSGNRITTLYCNR